MRTICWVLQRTKRLHTKGGTCEIKSDSESAPPFKAGGLVGGQIVKDSEPDEKDKETKESEKAVFAYELYYFDDPSIPATQTVETHLVQMEIHIKEFIETLDKTLLGYLL